MIVCLAGDETDHSFRELLSAAVQPAAILLPVAGILLVTQEWSQRTGLITFALVPDRRRVVAAKLGAGVVLGLGFALCGDRPRGDRHRGRLAGHRQRLVAAAACSARTC